MKVRKVKTVKSGPKVRKVSKGPRWKVFGGDCLDTLKRLKADSIDILVTDPPYGIKFMGRDWDKALPPVSVWRECLRVMKPGSFGFVMSSARQDCLARMILALESSGFVVDFPSIYWTYSKGMPKANQIDKAIDKRLGVERKVIGINPTWREAKRRNKKYQTVNGGSAQFMSEATSEEAKRFVGAYPGYNPKPAVEVIIVVMKPLSCKAYVDQALENGKGVTWFGDCKIPGGGVEGRLPANLLVSDDTLNDGRTIKTGEKSGSYSQYFDLDRWVAERLPEQVSKVWPWLIVSKSSKVEKTHDGRVVNEHDTVKPVSLMSYLVTLGSRPGDWILDPYCGSGTTGVSAVSLGRNFVGCELSEDWIKLSKDRINDTLRNNGRGPE